MSEETFVKQSLKPLLERLFDNDDQISEEMLIKKSLKPILERLFDGK